MKTDTIIYKYTREMAIRDRVLIDITPLAFDMGFKIPVAVTNTLYTKYFLPTQKEEFEGESTPSRIWDMLTILYLTSKNHNSNVRLFTMAAKFKNSYKLVTVKAVVSPGDTSDPVLTIMLPNED
ncbi:MAG: hypothetical protein B6229_08530 [Spirochaetaceae bacterium 4572_7]|nr:MAG: hypothetical protein B6229_08530 [Spirochaetaceae bacterium 4572_7]